MNGNGNNGKKTLIITFLIALIPVILATVGWAWTYNSYVVTTQANQTNLRKEVKILQQDIRELKRAVDMLEIGAIRTEIDWLKQTVNNIQIELQQQRRVQQQQ